ncbi:MAG: ATP-binding cassette domain-containing protein [Nitrososphaeria archaeon]|nr:ATP-binding cassette domain-containing protein [Nitrososphaeria archaeon]NIN52947.1 ATP-binding cassette domain-containing protein [Nitrososphaeria archaeon]NIQ33506.1 ATP-binding cassette domain-containing protein [Nitrososphaeria archaeon]
MNDLISLENIRMYFHAKKGFFRLVTVKAVDGVSLNIRRGETVAVVGESGCGKTTLGRVSLRLLRPTAGRVFFNGSDITWQRESELMWFRRRAQAIFQDPYSSIDPFMNVYQIVEESLLIHGVGERQERRELVYKALEDVKLIPVDEITTLYPHTLSGGQRQRVGIARALILSPDYIVADEPVSMIDASSRAEILHLLRGLQERYRITFFYITHDMATARHFSDRIAVMYLGRIVELGPTDKVIQEPLHPYIIALIEAVPEPDPANRLKERRVIPGEPPSPSTVPPGCVFHPRCPIAIKKCKTEEPRLEEHKEGHLVACHLAGKTKS